MTNLQSLVTVKVSPSASEGRGVRFRSRIGSIYGDEECEVTKPVIFSRIFELSMLTKNEKTNFVIGAPFVLGGTMWQAAAKTQKHVL